MSGLFNKIETSFKAAMKGEESTSILIKWWGISSYLVAYFIVERLVLKVDSRVVDVALSAITMLYFIWHIYVLRKCSPKKPKLSKEEKQYLRREARKNLGKKILRKLFLQEPITAWNPVTVTIVIDVICITHFLGYVLK